ncbi:hypothetical protein ACQKWADRAFT_309485 [Trichoderma austrokoningii]
MKSTLRSFSNYVHSLHPSQAPSPSSQQPTPEKDSSGGNNTKTSSNSNLKEAEYRRSSQESEDPTDPKNPKCPSLLVRFMVYASGGKLPSTIKKVTREVPGEAPKRQNGFSEWVFSENTAQYYWVVEKPRGEQPKKSKHHLDKETAQTSTGDTATHEEDAHKEDAHKKDEETSYDKIVNERRLQKSVAFAAPERPLRKPVPKATSRYSAPATPSSRSEECWPLMSGLKEAGNSIL